MRREAHHIALLDVRALPQQVLDAGQVAYPALRQYLQGHT